VVASAWGARVQLTAEDGQLHTSAPSRSYHAGLARELVDGNQHIVTVGVGIQIDINGYTVDVQFSHCIRCETCAANDIGFGNRCHTRQFCFLVDSCRNGYTTGRFG